MLNRFIYGKPHGSETPGVLALSGALSIDSAAAWRQVVTLDPLPITSPLASQTVGIFAASDEQYVLARTHNQEGYLTRPLLECVILSHDDLQTMSGNIRILADLFEEPIPAFDTTGVDIPPLSLPASPTWTADKRTTEIARLVSRHDNTMANVLAMLGASLDASHGLLIRGYPEDLDDRLDLIQGLLLLLPTAIRPSITFATYSADVTRTDVRVVFGEEPATTDATPTHPARWVVDYSQGLYPDINIVRVPYIDCLTAMWDGDPKLFVTELRSMELMSARQSTDQSPADSLTSVAERYMQDRLVLSGGNLPIAQVRAALADDPAPTGDLLARYVRLLLEDALETRDTESALQVTNYMDGDDSLDKMMQNHLSTALDDQPDAVYFVIRTRLTDGVDDRWVTRLQEAAVRSLDVAINDSDTTTLTSWLRLIAREPVAYQLSDVLQAGIAAAQERTHNDGDLGYKLILFAVKRAPNSIDLLLEDPELVAVLPEQVVAGLIDHDSDAVSALAAQGREVFLVALARAAEAEQVAVFTPDVIEQFWAILTDDSHPTMLPKRYQPETVRDHLFEGGMTWLSADALEALVTLALASQHDDLFYDSLPRLIKRNISVLPTALYRSGRPASDILTLIGQALNNELLTQQQAVDTYLQILSFVDWDEAMTPLGEQVARAVQQHPSLSLQTDTVWKLLAIAEEEKSDFVARAAVRRVLADIERREEERRIVNDLDQLVKSLGWTSSVRAFALNWWRDFARQQPLTRLQALEKALSLPEARRTLEDYRNVVQTTIALRKVLGKSTLEEFANAISTAYGVLQALSESFDPAPKNPISFDQDTVRAELETRQDELTPHEQRVLAKNLRELGALIASMAEHRTKAAVFRREDQTERQIITGSQPPQGAIDSMKWLSGYLDGAQDKDDDATP